MQELIDEIKRQIDANNDYIANNLKYDYDEIERLIGELFKDNVLNSDVYDTLFSVDYLNSDLNSLKVIYDRFSDYEKIKNILNSGINSIDVSEYKKLVSTLNEDLVALITKLHINIDDIELYKESYQDVISGLSNGWIDEFLNDEINVIINKQKSLSNEIKEYIKSLNNTLSKYKYLDTNTSNNSRNRNNKFIEISNTIKACKNKIRDLEAILKTCFLEDTIKPCPNYEEFIRLINFVKDSQIDDTKKLVIMFRLGKINKEYIDSLNERTNRAIISEIDANADVVTEELDEHYEENRREENIHGTSSEYHLITFEDIISQDSINKLELNGEELEHFNTLKELIEKYIKDNSIKSNVFENEENLFILDLIANEENESRKDYAVDNNSYKIFWDFVITDLHKNQDSKNDILDIIATISEALNNKNILDKKNETIKERRELIEEMINETDNYIRELVKIYKQDKENEKNKIIIDLSNFKENISNIDNDELLDDNKFNSLVNIYEALENSFNEFYNDEVVIDEPDINTDFDINNNNYVIFDESVKRQINKFTEKFYLEQIAKTIDILRDKNKFNNVNSDTSIRTLNGGVKDVYEVKDWKIRLFFVKVNNNTFYVCGILKKKKEGSSLVNETMRRFSELGNRKIEELKVEFANMDAVSIHNYCEDNYQAVVQILKNKFKKNKGNELGGASDESN